MITSLEVYSSLASPYDLPLIFGGQPDTDQIHIRDIQGLGPVKATVATRPYGSLDGEFHTGSQVGKRNIVITAGFNPDWVDETVESLREKLYAYFMPKLPVKLRFFRDNNPTVDINGIVESCEPAIFTKDPSVVVSIICPAPDFVASSATIIEGEAVADAEWFDFSARANLDTPLSLAVTADEGAPSYDGAVILELGTIEEIEDNRIFEVAGTVADGIELWVSSVAGNKFAKNIITVTAEETNLLPTVTDESVWPVIRPGVNKVRVLTESATAKNWTISYFERFGGI